MRSMMILSLAGLLLAACQPEVGSKSWCEKMKQTPAKQWSAEDAANYARHCLLK